MAEADMTVKRDLDGKIRQLLEERLSWPVACHETLKKKWDDYKTILTLCYTEGRAVTCDSVSDQFVKNSLAIGTAIMIDTRRTSDDHDPSTGLKVNFSVKTLYTGAI
eukprot:500510-Hanusia_phi.AAC.1